MEMANGLLGTVIDVVHLNHLENGALFGPINATKDYIEDATTTNQERLNDRITWPLHVTRDRQPGHCVRVVCLQSWCGWRPLSCHS